MTAAAQALVLLLQLLAPQLLLHYPRVQLHLHLLLQQGWLLRQGCKLLLGPL
jgi:hypothetical protein